MDLVVSAGASLLAGIGDGSILDGVPIGSLPHVRPILPMSPWPLSESLNIGVRDLYMSFKDQNAYSLYVPHYIDDAGVLYQLTHLNCLLINIYHSFMGGGPYQPGYIEYINLLQQQLDSCSPSELPQKLASLIDAQYNERLYHFYDQWFTHILGSNNTPPHRIHIRRIYELWVRDWYFEHVNIPSPLDQFAIVPFYPLQIGKLYFSFTNASFFLLLILSFVLFLFHLVTQKGGGKLVGNACQSVLELIYDFVPNLVNEQIGGLSGNVKQKYFPCISVTFTFSLFRNLQGMIPYSFTVTSHFLVTLGLSFSLFIGITIVGFAKNGLHFLSFSLPAGVPLPLAPFLVLLELIPHCFRALSLGIRLFANMMAGHSLVKILSGFAWTMLCMNDLFYFIGSTGPFFIVLALTGLELGVAILQAYVFTILICIYLNDAINLH